MVLSKPDFRISSRHLLICLRSNLIASANWDYKRLWLPTDIDELNAPAFNGGGFAFSKSVFTDFMNSESIRALLPASLNLYHNSWDLEKCLEKSAGYSWALLKFIYNDDIFVFPKLPPI